MTTTSHFQKNPDYYPQLCKFSKKNNTNPRYENYCQTHFTAGDEEQFQEYRDFSNGDISDVATNNVDEKLWDGYKNLSPVSVNNTFKYIFNKFKKGTFVKIQNNELKVFLPFSKKNFTNEWSSKIKIDPKFGTMEKFLNHINLTGNTNYKINCNKHIDCWYANNCLVRCEFPINEGDTNVPHMSDMLKTLCATRKVPDIEFFINRRDFPLLKRNLTEPYDHLWDSDNHPLVSHQYTEYSPILSMVTTTEFADIPIPTCDDWARISRQENKFFEKDSKQYPSQDEFKLEWKHKKPTAVFRGSSTGAGVTINTNMRLKASSISQNSDETGIPLLDACITKWQLRPRKIKGIKYLQTIDVPSLGLKLGSFLSPVQQSEYKYILHIDGNVSAYRLSLELGTGCCVLLVDSKYKVWYRDMLIPYTHYIPIDANLTDLCDKIKWCRKNDKECENIAKNARLFFNKYLQKDGILDHFQNTLISLKNHIGVYLYNCITPLHRQIELELEEMKTGFYPKTDKTVKDIHTMPQQGRLYSILKGFEWIVNMIKDCSDIKKIAIPEEVIFNTKTTNVQSYSIADFSFIIKHGITSEKIRQNIHESYIGTKVINNIVKYIPNFAYVFGIENKCDLIMEYIYGQTLDKWILTKFNMQNYIFILIQVCLALEIAQKQFGFVHYDCTPWNIVIQELDKPISFDYLLSHKHIIRVTTQIVPIFIDYGKSHVIHDNKHYGYTNMYRMSTVQDVISLLLTSIYEITTLNNLNDRDVSDLIKLSNFLSGSQYRTKPFRRSGSKGLSDVQYFFKKAKKYSELISSNKYDLEKYTPIDLVDYINKNFDYKFPVEHTSSAEFCLNKGDPYQVFEYVLSSTKEDRIKSFMNVLHRSVPELNSTETYLVYNTVQIAENHITSVRNLLKKYGNNAECDSIYESVIKKIKQLLSKVKTEHTVEIKHLDTQPEHYTEEIFLQPEKILDMISNSNLVGCVDRITLELVLCNCGIFKMPDQLKSCYIDKYKEFLNSRPIVGVANRNTLLCTAGDIYSLNTERLVDKKLNSVQKYVDIYKSINNKINKNNKSIKIVSWNVNGIRSNVLCTNKLEGGWKKDIDKVSNLGELISMHDPDIICLQETKCDEKVYDNIKIPNFHQYWSSSKGAGARSGNRYSGVSVWSKIKPLKITYEIPSANPDKEGRVIVVDYGGFILINTYCPNSGTNFEYRTQVWDKEIRSYLKLLRDQGNIVVWCGDLNVSHEPIDVFFSDKKSSRYSKTKMDGVGKNAIAGFTKEERENFTNILNEGYIDTFRYFMKEMPNQYTWWNLRMPSDRCNNLGMRLDYFVITDTHINYVEKSEILSKYGLLTKPHASDHAPILLTLDKKIIKNIFSE